MKNKIKLIFTKDTVKYVIEALGFEEDEKGYIIDNNEEFVLDADGKKFKSDNLIGAVKGYWFTSEEQIKRVFPNLSDDSHIV